MNEIEVKKILEQNLAQVEDIKRCAFQKYMIAPYSEVRSYSDSKWEQIWIVAKMPAENISIAYSEKGYDGFGLPWGLLFLDRSSMGDSGAWYRTLGELIDDCGFF